MASEPPQINERWQYKPNRGWGVFTIAHIHGDRITLRSTFSGKTKTIGLRTLRSDYRRIDPGEESRQ